MRPDSAAASGSTDVSVSPGEIAASRNHGVPASSTTTSVREMSRRPSARCAVTAAAAVASSAGNGSGAGISIVMRSGL